MDEPEGPRLAQPTDVPATVPARANATPNETEPNYADGGYGLPDPWLPGNAWEWESPTRWQSLRVEEAFTRDGREIVRVVQMRGPLGPGPLTRFSWEVDTTDWTRLSQTGIENARNLTFDPPAGGLRAYRNATVTYRETSPTGTTNVTTQFLYKGPTRASVAWGEVHAGLVEETTTREGTTTQTFQVTRYVSHEYGHDVRFTVGPETYRLVAVDYRGIERGVFRDV